MKDGTLAMNVLIALPWLHVLTCCVTIHPGEVFLAETRGDSTDSTRDVACASVEAKVCFTCII